MSKRIALIHATPVAMQPVVEAFRHGWTDADTFSVLDDALSTDLARAGTLNVALKRRIAALAEYVTGIGIDAILYLLGLRRGHRRCRPYHTDARTQTQ